MPTFNGQPLPGRLVVLEGIDCSGKDTQLEALHYALTQKGIAVRLTESPSRANFVGRHIRQILTHEIPYPGRETMITLFAAAEYICVREVILPALQDGWCVLSSRYFYSTYAYNVETDEEARALMDIHTRTVVLPDMVIWLQLPVHAAVGRMQYRDMQAELYEKEDVLERVARKYGDLFTRGTNPLYDPILHGVQVVPVDALYPKGEITQALITRILTTYYPEKLS